MTPLQTVVVLAAGFTAGGLNAVIGAGTLLTFPALLAVGIAPVTANVSNTLGLVPGSLAGAFGYRRELRLHRSLLPWLVFPAATGGLVGAGLLLVLPAKLFAAIVPVLLVLAAILVALQPRLARRVAGGRNHPIESTAVPKALVGSLLFLAGIYGGYFGAGFSVLVLALLGIILEHGLQAANGSKNLVSAGTNLAASIVFVLAAQPDWAVVGALAVSSLAGGLVGARYGRALPDGALRIAIIAIALGSALKLLLN